MAASPRGREVAVDNVGGASAVSGRVRQRSEHDPGLSAIVAPQRYWCCKLWVCKRPLHERGCGRHVPRPWMRAVDSAQHAPRTASRLLTAVTAAATASGPPHPRVLPHSGRESTRQPFEHNRPRRGLQPLLEVRRCRVAGPRYLQPGHIPRDLVGREWPGGGSFVLRQWCRAVGIVDDDGSGAAVAAVWRRRLEPPRLLCRDGAAGCADYVLTAVLTVHGAVSRPLIAVTVWEVHKGHGAVTRPMIRECDVGAARVEGVLNVVPAPRQLRFSMNGSYRPCCCVLVLLHERQGKQAKRGRTTAPNRQTRRGSSSHPRPAS